MQEKIRRRRGLEEEQDWAANEECLYTASSDNREHAWSKQQARGKVERGRGAFVGGLEGWRGEAERNGEGWQQQRQREGELCWERASKRALGWERRREMGGPLELERQEKFWERRGRRREGRWPAFLSREKAQLAAEFRRLGIGACLAGTRGRQDLDCTSNLNIIFLYSEFFC